MRMIRSAVVRSSKVVGVRSHSSSAAASLGASSSIQMRIPTAGVVESLLKGPGDALSFGEPFALLKSGSEEPVAVTSPVTGQLVSLNVKVGESVKPETDFAVFQGRRPLIQFRHGKGRLAHASSSSSAASSPNVSKPAPQQQAQSTPAAAEPTKEGTKPLIRRKSFMEVPANYGRLPPLSQKEMTLLISGGAYDS